MQPDTLGILEDMLEAVEYILDDAKTLNYESFLENRHVRESIQWNFVVIGESAHRLRKRHADIASRIRSINQIVGFRHAIIHGYDRIDYPTVWNTIQDRLTVLKADIESILMEQDTLS